MLLIFSINLISLREKPTAHLWERRNYYHWLLVLSLLIILIYRHRVKLFLQLNVLFQVSLWGGGVALHNLVLKPDVLQQEVKLPFTLISGRIHELLIQVPWTKIMSEPITVAIDTIGKVYLSIFSLVLNVICLVSLLRFYLIVPLNLPTKWKKETFIQLVSTSWQKFLTIQKYYAETNLTPNTIGDSSKSKPRMCHW